MSDPYKLMTIGPSHYCEKARWALDFFGVPYDEEPHPPIVHWGWSLRSGGGRWVPILCAGERVIGDSTDILHFLDEQHGNGCRLSDGREFLVGRVFTAADLSFASLAAPVLVPFEYGASLPSLEELPAAVVELASEFRATAAGDFGLRLYRDHR